MAVAAETAEGSVRAVERALDILLAFKPHDDALTVSDLLGRVDLSRPTLYRLLRTLRSKGFLTSTENPKRFRLGPSVAQLAHVWTSVLDLASAAEPMMRRLWEGTSETVALFVREDMSRVCVAELPSAQALSFRRGVGYRESLARGASGKVILAHLPETEAKALQAEAKRGARELAQIRDRGFAVSKNELITRGGGGISAAFQRPGRGYRLCERVRTERSALRCPNFDFRAVADPRGPRDFSGTRKCDDQ